MGTIQWNYATTDTTAGTTRTITVPAGQQWTILVFAAQGNGVAGMTASIGDGTNDLPLSAVGFTGTDGTYYYFPSNLNQDVRQQVGDSIKLDAGCTAKITWGAAAKTPASYLLVEVNPI